MKKIFGISLLLIIILIQCSTNENNYSINGKLETNNFNGEYVYLVPYHNATKNKVDSFLITNGQFTFKGTVNESQLYILRTRPLLRLKLQELLIIKEPGRINVILTEISSASGTVSNDSLQHWKECKMEFDSQVRLTLNRLKTCENETEQEQLKQYLDSIMAQIDTYNKAFIKNNSTNEAGKLVAELLYPNQSLTP